MINYLKTKGKGITVYIFFLIALAVFVCSIFAGCAIFDRWFGILAGVLLSVLAVPFHFFLGRKTAVGHFLSYFFNTVSAGFSVSAYYTVKSVSLVIDKLAYGILLSVFVMLILSLLMVIMRENKHILIVIFAIIELGLIITSIVFWVNRGGEIYAIMFFALVLSSFYTAVLAVTVDEDERTAIRDCSFGSYGFYLVATVVVIVILLGAAGCDDCSCDGCDCSGCCDSDKPKSKNRIK